VLSLLSIPLDVPATLRDLALVAKAQGWTGPAAMTEVRNSIVHPDQRSRGKLDDVLWDTSLLAVRYVELILLALLGHNGLYASRVDLPQVLGKVVKVP